MDGVLTERRAAVSSSNSATTESEEAESAQAEQQESEKARSFRPASTVGWLAERTWWLPWLFGVAAIVVGAVIVLESLNDGPGALPDQRRKALPRSNHKVVYEVTGVGQSPEIQFTSSGSNDIIRVAGASLPWRKELTISVGPSVGIAQVLAANSGKSKTVACSIRIDGQLVNQQTASGEFSSVSCSAVIYP